MPEHSNESTNPRFREGLAFRDVDVDEVVGTVRAVDPVGSGVDRIARRIDSGIRNRKAGFHNGRPLTLLLASGVHGEPDIVARAIAEAMVGRDMDCAPLIFIQAEHYIGEGDLLAPLLGPVPQGAPAPLLDERRLFSPYVLNRIGRTLQPLRHVIYKMGSAMQVIVSQAQQATQAGDRETVDKLQGEIRPMLTELYTEAEEQASELLNSIRPNRAVIYISGLEHMIAANGSRDVQAFRQLLQKMCVEGYAEIRESGKTYFQDCIIIGSYQAADVARVDNEKSQEVFRRIVDVLSGSVTGRELIDNFGGERSIIVLDAPTEETQMQRLAQKLQSLKQELVNSFEITLFWEDDAFEHILQKSADPDRAGNYPSPRLDARFDELVIGAIAGLVLAEGMVPNMGITLSMVGDTLGIRADMSDVSEEDLTPISSDEIREVFSRETPVIVGFPPEVSALQDRLTALLESPTDKTEETAPSGQYL